MYGSAATMEGGQYFDLYQIAQALGVSISNLFNTLLEHSRMMMPTIAALVVISYGLKFFYEVANAVYDEVYRALDIFNL